MIQIQVDTLFVIADDLIKILKMIRGGDGKLTVKEIQSVVVFFQRLMGVAVPIQRINQLIAEFLIKGFNGNSGLTQGGDLGKGFLCSQKMNGIVDQLLIQRMVIGADRDDPGFVLRFWKKISPVKFNAGKQRERASSSGRDSFNTRVQIVSNSSISKTVVYSLVQA